MTPTAWAMSPWPFCEATCSKLGTSSSCGGLSSALELAEHDAEEQVAPRRLGERGGAPAELRQFVARGVDAVGHRDERPEQRVLDERGDRALAPTRAAASAARGSRRRRRTRRRWRGGSRCRRRGQAGPRVTALPSSSVSSYGTPNTRWSSRCWAAQTPAAPSPARAPRSGARAIDGHQAMLLAGRCNRNARLRYRRHGSGAAARAGDGTRRQPPVLPAGALLLPAVLPDLVPAASGSAASTSRTRARSSSRPTTARSWIRSRSPGPRSGRCTSSPRRSCSRRTGCRPGSSARSARSRSTAAPATRTRWRPPAASSSAATA